MNRSALLCAAVLVLSATPSLAQTAQERSAARSAAESGISAFNEGNYERALDLLKRAESVVHAPPHILFIARSHVKMGQLVAGREAYLKIVREELATNAPQAFQKAREDARAELAEVDSRIPRATIVVEGASTEEAHVTVDGEPFLNISLGVPTPIDPGEHVIEASAPGMAPVRKTTVIEDGTTPTIVLTLESSTNKAAPLAATSASQADDKSDPRKDGGNGSTQRILGWTTLGVGAAALAFGGVTGILGFSEKSNLECNGTVCPPGTDLGKYNGLRAMSMVGIIAGGVVAASGLTLLLTAPSSKESAYVSPYVGVTSVGIAGAF